MIAGHFGFAAGMKDAEPSAPLWALMLATVWLDVVFAPLYALGVERIDLIAGSHRTYGNGIIHADYTHSLLGAALLAALFGAVAARRWGRRVGTILGAVVFSHWVLDLVVHRADMPLLPGNAGHLSLLGFGLWRLPAVSAAVELTLVLAGSLLYWRAARRAMVGVGSADRRRASTLAVLLAVAGAITLALDVFVG